MQVQKESQQTSRPKAKAVTKGEQHRKAKHHLNSGSESHAHFSLGRSSVTVDHTHSKATPLITPPSAANILVTHGETFSMPSVRKTTPIGKSKQQATVTGGAVVLNNDLLSLEPDVTSGITSGDNADSKITKRKKKKKKDSDIDMDFGSGTKRRDRKRKRTFSDSLSIPDGNDYKVADNEDDVGDIDVTTPLSGHAPLNVTLKKSLMKEERSKVGGEEGGGTKISSGPKKKKRRREKDRSESLLISIDKNSVSKYQQRLKSGSPSDLSVVDPGFSMTTPTVETSALGRLSPAELPNTPDACQVMFDGQSTKLIIRSDKVRNERKKKKNKKHKKKKDKNSTKEEIVSLSLGEVTTEATPSVQFMSPLRVTIKIDGT